MRFCVIEIFERKPQNTEGCIFDFKKATSKKRQLIRS